MMKQSKTPFTRPRGFWINDMRTGQESDGRFGKSRMPRFLSSIALACGLAFAGAPAFSGGALAQGAQPAQGPAPTLQNRAAQKKTRLAQPPAQPTVEPHAKREPKGFIETIMQGPRLTTTPPEAADWVRQSRGAPTAARAPQAAAPAPARRLLTADEIRAREAALDSARARHDRIAGRKAQTGKVGSAAGKPQVATAEKRKAGCVMTCATPIGVPQTQRR